MENGLDTEFDEGDFDAPLVRSAWCACGRRERARYLVEGERVCGPCLRAHRRGEPVPESPAQVAPEPHGEACSQSPGYASAEPDSENGINEPAPVEKLAGEWKQRRDETGWERRDLGGRMLVTIRAPGAGSTSWSWYGQGAERPISGLSLVEALMDAEQHLGAQGYVLRGGFEHVLAWEGARTPSPAPPLRKVREGPLTLHCRSPRPDAAGRSTYELIQRNPRRVEVLGLLTHEEALGVLRERASKATQKPAPEEDEPWPDPIDRVFFNLEAGPRPKRRHLPVMDALALLANAPIPPEPPPPSPPAARPASRGAPVHDAPPPPPSRADRAAALRRRVAALDALEGLPAVDQLLVRPDGVDDGTWAAVREAVATALHRRGEQLEVEAFGGLP